MHTPQINVDDVVAAADTLGSALQKAGAKQIQRSTLYDVRRRFDDPALDPPSLEPDASERVIAGPERFRDGARVRQRRALVCSRMPFVCIAHGDRLGDLVT